MWHVMLFPCDVTLQGWEESRQSWSVTLRGESVRCHTTGLRKLWEHATWRLCFVRLLLNCLLILFLGARSALFLVRSRRPSSGLIFFFLIVLILFYFPFFRLCRNSLISSSNVSMFASILYSNGFCSSWLQFTSNIIRFQGNSRPQMIGCICPGVLPISFSSASGWAFGCFEGFQFFFQFMDLFIFSPEFWE